MPLSQCEPPHTPLEQFLNYSTERGRMGRPVKNVGMPPDEQTLAPSRCARLTVHIGSGACGSRACRARAAADHDCRARRLTVSLARLMKTMKQPVERRLAAILTADMVGYSRLMGADEEGTHARLKAHRRALVDPKIAEHHGRIVKNTGDGLLAEFLSVVDAVRCAVEVQRGMAERNTATPSQQRIEFRVGINLGDVIIEGDDIFGDGVNITARLEALAKPGGVCVSRVVRRQVG